MKTTATQELRSRHCEYCSGPCNQGKNEHLPLAGFFIYPSTPAHLARTVAESVRQLQKYSSKNKYQSWEDLAIGGHIVFCKICNAIEAAKLVVANVTTLNFNVLFELGYAIGMQKPVLPIRDTTITTDRKLFDKIGIFDTLGYNDFTNSTELVSLVGKSDSFYPPIQTQPDPNRDQPIYYLRAPVQTDGGIKIESCLNKSYFPYRTFDSKEMSRLSLHEAYRQALSSVSVIAHLIDPSRAEADSHNSRAAFVCGMAMAAGKHVLMLQEGEATQPIDYRDVVVAYTQISTLPYRIEPFLQNTSNTLRAATLAHSLAPKGLLQKLDLGDVAAENEAHALSNYFVKTPQFQQASQGHARLVIGRKGSGKTAIFYGVRNHIAKNRDMIVIDLKPEGHQFTSLRDSVLKKLDAGTQERTLTAMWHYLLLLEMMGKILARESLTAYRDRDALLKYQQLEELHKKHVEPDSDFSERLMSLAGRLVSSFENAKGASITGTDLTSAIYGNDIGQLQRMILEHLSDIDGIWILFDNIDKGFSAHGLQKEDILVVRCLLDASRKLQHSFEKKNINCVSTVFIRRDVFTHLIDNTPDRGKENYANLDWSDMELIRDLLLLRFRHEAPELVGSFEHCWSQLFDPHVSGESSFRYITSRTFLRPRDILNFTRKCIQVAVSRGNSRVEQDDIKKAEEEFSEDMLNELMYEIRDVFPNMPDIPLAFIGQDRFLSSEDLSLILMGANVPEEQVSNVVDRLLWFSFIGVAQGDDEFYSYTYLYNIDKLKAQMRGDKPDMKRYVIHPAFNSALSL